MMPGVFDEAVHPTIIKRSGPGAGRLGFGSWAI
jgi:hypothetical protein